MDKIAKELTKDSNITSAKVNHDGNIDIKTKNRC